MQSVDNPFWKDVMKHYRKLYLKCCPTSIHDFMAECIHYNINILRDRKVIFVQLGLKSHERLAMGSKVLEEDRNTKDRDLRNYQNQPEQFHICLWD